MKDIEGRTFAELTTFGVGGPIARVRECGYALEVQDAVKEAKAAGRPWMVVGGGSNLLASSSPFEGDVIRLCGLNQLYWDKQEVRVGAGVVWDELVRQSAEKGFAGLECMSGIPGEVGGGVVQNVGAYGQEVSAALVEVDVYDADDDDFLSLSPAECEYAYRSSLFKANSRYVVLGATMRLAHAGAAVRVDYTELQREIGKDKASVLEVRAAVLTTRARKGMVVDATDADTRGAGSFFTNPIVDAAAADKLLAEHPACPRYEAGDGKAKLAAAWLIESAGFARGGRRGAVGQSTKHALALVNKGGATGEEVWKYAREIAEAVQAKFGVRLSPEPVAVGLPPFS